MFPRTARPRPPPSSGHARTCSTRDASCDARGSGPTRCEALLRQGVDVFFGYPGGVILPLYDVLGDYPECATSSSATSRAPPTRPTAMPAPRAVGVCLGTSGPGATNLVTGIGTAQLDSVPMVAITGNVPGALIGKDAFQEIDITGITLPMTKHNYLVRNADDIPRVIAEAFHIARTGRPGPVHVDITKDALQQETRAGHPTETSPRRAAGLPPKFDGHPRSSASPPTRSPAPSGPSSSLATAFCIARRGTSSGRSPRRTRSRSPTPCSASASSTRRIR